MNVSHAWLRAVAPGIEDDVHASAERLALRGAPVEELVDLSEGLEGVIVARVEEVRPHPDADRLSVCRVVHPGGEVEVVCGAPDVRAGQAYAFAPVGTTLPGGVEIRRVEIRGVQSEGMLCSARELGLGTDHSGLMELPGSAQPGRLLVDEIGLRDWRLDVEVTPNRGDLLSHVGVARELAPGGDAGVSLPAVPGGSSVTLPWSSDPEQVSASGVTLRIEDPELCWRYLGAVIRGVRVGPSPAWLQQRLRAAGARPINNVVDATNYVMLEMGQPLHAFDLDRLEDHTIVVRRARPDEPTFTTLDGVERTLSTDMLLICDARRPVAIAGVMGGEDSEVSADTRDVLLECALFAPASIRATRSALSMSTDASYRFERGVDPESMTRAAERALEIIVATAGGTLEATGADCLPRPWSAEAVTVRLARIEHLLGVELSAGDVRGLLEPLGFRCEDVDGGLRARVPGYRSYDVRREVDVIEEVARTHGYDRFPDELRAYRPNTVPDHPLFALEDRVRVTLAERGWLEAQTPAFVPEGEGDVRIANPVSLEEAFLRRDVLPSLVRRVEYNLARGQQDVRLFEIATSFTSAEPGELPHEETRLAVAYTGRRRPPHWASPDEAFDVWDLKGLLSSLAERVDADLTVDVATSGDGRWVAGTAFRVLRGDDTVGWGGAVAASLLDVPAWVDRVWGLELTLPARPVTRPPEAVRPLPPYPGIERDLALAVPDEVPAARVETCVREHGGADLRDVEVFDSYRGEGVTQGSRSLAYRLRFQSWERTLTDEEVDRAVEHVVNRLEEDLGVRIRA